MPRYRQRVRRVPGHVANPVWVDDPHFDLGYHVRRSALPQPGHDRAAARARRPDRVAARSTGTARCGRSTSSRVSSDGRVAVLTKAHQALVDGVQIVDLAQVLLDRSPGAARARAPTTGARSCRPAPSGLLARRGPRLARLAAAPSSTPPAVSRTSGGAVPRQPRRRVDGVVRTRSPAAAPTRRARSAARCPSSAGSCPCDAPSPSTAPCATPTAAPSTTSSWPP